MSMNLQSISSLNQELCEKIVSYISKVLMFFIIILFANNKLYPCLISIIEVICNLFYIVYLLILHKLNYEVQIEDINKFIEWFYSSIKIMIKFILLWIISIIMTFFIALKKI